MKTIAFAILTLLTLPITFAQYQASNRIEVETQKEEGLTTIHWTSHQEVNSSYYLIERSDDGIQFYTIGQTKAGSSTYRSTDYAFEDVEAREQFHTYRVTLVLMDGQQISVLEQPNAYDNLVDTLGK